jgi:Domain of unknown function (DUF4136)
MKKLFGFTMMILLLACASPKVLDVSTAPDANFSQYKTFAFYELTAMGDTITEGFNERVDYLKKAIASEMTQRQFKQVSQQADLLINIGIAIKLEVLTRQTSWAQDGMMRYMGQRNYKWQSEEIETGRYRKGAITLHIVDAAKNHMLWTATLKGALPDDSTKVVSAAAKGINTLFKQFPVPIAQQQ